MTISLLLRPRRRSNRKQKSRTANNDVVLQYFMNLLENFNDFSYLEYRKRQIKYEPTEAYLFLVKQMYQLLNNKKHIILRNEIIKSGVISKKHAKEMI